MMIKKSPWTCGMSMYISIYIYIYIYIYIHIYIYIYIILFYFNTKHLDQFKHSVSNVSETMA